VRKALSLIILGVSLAAVALAQGAGAEAASKEDILRFMDLMQLRARMDQLVAGMKQGMKVGAEAGFRQKIANPTPDQLEAIDKLVNSAWQDFPLDELIDAIVPIYQRHLTKADVGAIVAFYSSPVGQKLLREQPAMMAEGMQAGQEIMLRKIPELTGRLNTEVAKLADQELQKSGQKGVSK